MPLKILRRYAGWYLLFCWFWTSEFIIAMGQIVVAMALSMWYFTRDKATIGSGTVIAAIRKSFRYHMGTAAFGSLIIAIIKLIRAIIAYLQKKAAKSSFKRLASAVLCAIQCCLWCIEKCMKFLNKNAYIQTAIFGYSFCKAARKAFFLILRNIARIAATAMVSEFVLIIGQILVPLSTLFLAYMVMDAQYGDELNGIWGPLFFTFIIAWYTTKMFNETFGMAISTILQCFVADEEMFEPNDRFAEGPLKATIAKTSEEVAAHETKGKVTPVTSVEEAKPMEVTSATD